MLNVYGRLKKHKITQVVDSIHTKNMQNLPTRFPNKKGILVLTPTLLKFMSLFLNKFKLGFCSDTYLPFGPNSRFLLFFFWRSSLSKCHSNTLTDTNQWTALSISHVLIALILQRCSCLSVIYQNALCTGVLKNN